MNRPSLRRWLGGGLLGCAALVGCHHADRSCPTCGGQARVATAAPPGPELAVAPVIGSPYGLIPPAPVVHETLKPTPEAATRPPETSGWQTVSGLMREKTLERRTFTDLTANPAFAHAPDYSWLVGELRSMGPGVWSVRFASVDEDRDTVVLVDAPPIIDLKPGQLVHVEGQLVDPTTRDAPAEYRVTAIRPADRN